MSTKTLEKCKFTYLGDKDTKHKQFNVVVSYSTKADPYKYAAQVCNVPMDVYTYMTQILSNNVDIVSSSLKINSLVNHAVVTVKNGHVVIAFSVGNPTSAALKKSLKTILILLDPKTMLASASRKNPVLNEFKFSRENIADAANETMKSLHVLVHGKKDAEKVTGIEEVIKDVVSKYKPNDGAKPMNVEYSSTDKTIKVPNGAKRYILHLLIETVFKRRPLEMNDGLYVQGDERFTLDEKKKTKLAEFVSKMKNVDLVYETAVTSDFTDADTICELFKIETVASLKNAAGL